MLARIMVAIYHKCRHWPKSCALRGLPFPDRLMAVKKVELTGLPIYQCSIQGTLLRRFETDAEGEVFSLQFVPINKVGK